MTDSSAAASELPISRPIPDLRRAAAGRGQRLAATLGRGGLSRFRFACQVLADGVAWFAALFVADLLRHDLDFKGIAWGPLAGFALFATAVHVAIGSARGLYIGRWPVGSFEEVALLMESSVATAVALYALNLATDLPLPRSVMAGSGLIAVVFTAGSRYGYRSVVTRRPVPDGGARTRLLVFGAGDGGYQLVRALLHDRSGGYVPVAVLDDDAHKRHRRVHGVPVVGDRTRLGAAAAKYGARTVVIAIPSADATLIGELTALGHEAGVAVKTLPSVAQLLGTEPQIVDIRDVTEEDLLGRHRRVHTDIVAVADYLAGKRVLVTGAGGSIGSELCRQLGRFGPAELMMLDRDESALHAVQMSIEGRALLDSDSLILADLRDRRDIARIFAYRRPQVVFHTAALKHLPLLERHPGEAVKTNVWGTMTLLEAAAANGVERFVNISTDKAAFPQSALGYSKRICERLTAHYAAETGRPFLSVRFGNVLGSRGSVLGAFRAQIRAGGPITVTDPEVTRYFMTVEEAVHLVIEAGALGRPGEALVLDMGEPVRILEVARLLASRTSHPVEIVFTGLRPGEKLHEDLWGEGETDSRPEHPLISHVWVPALEPGPARDLDAAAAPEVVRSALRSVCGQGLAAREVGRR